MATAPVFPPELEREIFETAAVRHRNTIPALLRVARRVLTWIEPLLYRVIRLDDASMAHAVRRAMQTKPAGFFQKSVRYVSFVSSPLSVLSVEETYALLRLCPRILSLHTRPATPALVPILQGMSQLRMWSGSLQELFGNSAIDLSLPSFRTVTHMTLLQEFLGPITVLLALPALTHLGLRGSNLDLVQRVLDECTYLQVVVNLWHYTNTHLAIQGAHRPPIMDVRYVVCVYRDEWDEWELGARGGLDYWEAADAFIARKRRGKYPAWWHMAER
ncbi:hypothetical protein FB451DRAFT_686851 [Mycena latifolia]|nr:hypothetical protein FB451DRAFT_686851 [Mycena latifolia]